MKIVNIIGGLGNQMFQYAFALALKKNYPNDSIYIDTHHFKGYDLHNGYELNRIFNNVNLPIANKKLINKISFYIPHYKLSRFIRKVIPAKKTEYIEKQNYIYYQEVFNNKIKDCYYEGFWQCSKYFLNIKDEIIHAFKFPEPSNDNVMIAKKMQNCESVGIHIRRGDYLNDKEYMGICDIDYYVNAINKIGHCNKEFFIFSNDIEWCRINILPLLHKCPVKFIDNNKGQNSFWDMFLLSKCKYLIIANSSFSWWGAFLNKNVIRVIAPKKWINRNHKIEIHPSEWELI